ncbi:MAG: DCC1-like thiol-disulfide oxidoreductase family protein [Tepidisphaeraceae bacterium]
MTNNTDRIEIDRGVIFYDGACGICGNSARWFDRFLARRGFAVLPLQSPEATAMTGASHAALMTEVHLVTPARRVLRGVDAVMYIASAIPWTAPLRWLTKIPGAMPLMRRGYAWFARNRYGASALLWLRAPEVCRVPPRVSSRRCPRLPLYPDRSIAEVIARWQPPIVALMAALVAGASLPPWVYMWTIALTLYAACKWITWWPSRSLGTWRRSAAYLFAYAGMNARAFLSAAAPVQTRSREFVFPIANAALGIAAILILAASPTLASSHPMLTGWAAMFALALLCHFGMLNLLALLLRRAGIAAEPLMRTPIASRSLADFWGRRWNTGFRTLSHELIFDPLTRRIGLLGATAVAFLVSGLIHDLVISLPANAGYGRPTLYFLIQLAGVFIERTTLVRQAFSRHPWGVRLLAVMFTLAPLPLLFHAAFVERCILPFLTVIGGLL